MRQLFQLPRLRTDAPSGTRVVLQNPFTGSSPEIGYTAAAPYQDPLQGWYVRIDCLPHRDAALEHCFECPDTLLERL